MDFIIVKIDTFVQNREQGIHLYLKGRKKPLSVAYKNMCSVFWQLPVTELELLIDSLIRPEYFQKGELLKNGRIANSSNYHIKNWRIEPFGTEPEVRAKNGGLCLCFTHLYDTYIFTRKNRQVVRIRDTNGGVYFTDLPILERLLGIKEEEFHLLRGAFISPTFYKAGETSEETQWLIYEDNKILKDLNCRVINSIDHNYTIFGQRPLQSDRHSNDSQGYDEYDRRSFEKYNGYNGFDDQTIDEAFNGDPEATWNVD